MIRPVDRGQRDSPEETSASHGVAGARGTPSMTSSREFKQLHAPKPIRFRTNFLLKHDATVELHDVATVWWHDEGSAVKLM